MSSVVFPIHAEELTPELLTRTLSERHPSCGVEGLRVVEQAQDVTYLLVTGLDSEVRRRDERELLGFHLDRLSTALAE